MLIVLDSSAITRRINQQPFTLIYKIRSDRIFESDSIMLIATIVVDVGYMVNHYFIVEPFNSKKYSRGKYEYA